MLFYLLILAGICLYKLKVADHRATYMSPEQTTSVKGIFVAIILLSHMQPYMTPSLLWDDLALRILREIGQLMVTVFFFYSGYGVLSSAGKKENYGKTFFRNRLCKTWLHFAIAVACYLVLSVILGTQYELWDYLLCITGWTSLGNSNWFVFVMLALYAITWVGLVLTQGMQKKMARVTLPVVVTLLSWVLWKWLPMAGKSAYWYNTLFCYAAGMWFFLCKPLFDKLIGKWYLRIGIWVACLAVYYVLYKIPGIKAYSLYACVFCLLVVLLTTNVRMDNPILRWLGKNTFTVYIFQRIPMLILEALGWTQYNILFMIATVVVAMVLAEAFSRIYNRLDRLLFENKRK